MYFISDIADFFDTSKVYDFGSFAMYSIVGLLIVILALGFLILLLTGISKILNIEIPKKEVSSSVTTEVQSNDTNDEELVAAITAAISIALETECGCSKPVPFKIKSIKKN